MLPPLRLSCRSMGMDYATVTRLIEDLAATGERRGDYQVGGFDFGEDLRVKTFLKPAGYTMVKLSKVEQSNIGTFVQIAGGGAVNVPGSSDLCRSIFARHIDLDWGGPFVRAWPDGTMTYGCQVTVPGAALASDGNGGGYLMGMIDLMGEVAKSIARDLVPHFGGALLDGTGANDENDLFTALVGPPPESGYGN
jgi:hypothetical protein